MAKYLLGTAAGIAVVVLGIAVYETYSVAMSLPITVQTQQVTPITITSATTTTTATTSNSYTLTQIAEHSTAANCWTAINGNVYDLTNWINQHPGGPEMILAICGTDGSTAFNEQHGGQTQPEQELANFYIGTLAS